MRIFGLFSAILVSVLASQTAGLAGELRVWTAAGGVFTVEAEFVETKPGDVVRLKTKDGRHVDVPLGQLSPADQEFVRRAKPERSVAWKRVERSAARCRLPADALAVFQSLHDDPKAPADDRAAAAEKIAELRALVAQNKVRLNNRWVPAAEAAAVRAQANTLLRQGLELFKLRQEDAFRRKFAEAKKLESEEMRVDFLAGLIYTAHRRPEKALSFFRQCLVLDPENVAVLNNTALLAASMEDWGLMQACWRKSLEVQPDQRVIHNVGRFLEQAAAADVATPPGARNALSAPYVDLVGSGRYDAWSPQVGWLFLLLEDADLDFSYQDKAALKRSSRPGPTADGPVIGGGSGFVVSPGYVLTSAHTSDDGVTFEIQQPGGKTLRAERVARSIKTGLTLLRCPELPTPPLRLASGVAPLGAQVLMVSFPEMPHLEPQARAALGLVTDLPDPQTGDIYRYDLPSGLGSGGGPVCNDQGDVVAMHVADIDKSRRGGVAGTFIASFLREHIPNFQPPAVEVRKRHWAEVEEMAAFCTVIVWARNKNSPPRISEVDLEYVELPLCLFCGGTRHRPCSNPLCEAGRIDRDGRSITCRVCNGANTVCKACNGEGDDRRLREVWNPVARAAGDTNNVGQPIPKFVRGTPVGGIHPSNHNYSPEGPRARCGEFASFRLGGSVAELPYEAGVRTPPDKQLADAELDAIAAALGGKDPEKARDAARSLYLAIPVEARQAEIAGLLENWMKFEPGWTLRCACVRALETWRGPHSAEVIRSATRDASWTVRLHAVAAIAHTRDFAGVPTLIDRLRRPLDVPNNKAQAKGERRNVVIALIALGPEARPQIEPLLNDADMDVRAAALELVQAYDKKP